MSDAEHESSMAGDSFVEVLPRWKELELAGGTFAFSMTPRRKLDNRQFLVLLAGCPQRLIWMACAPLKVRCVGELKRVRHSSPQSRGPTSVDRRLLLLACPIRRQMGRRAGRQTSCCRCRSLRSSRTILTGSGGKLAVAGEGPLCLWQTLSSSAEAEAGDWSAEGGDSSRAPYEHVLWEKKPSGRLGAHL
jgi:hypothetical protein